ncbi:Transcription factor tau subunit [Wickerhamiella sorbophila]|uniref:Transcription factor tau subunit n=1 Tax=Wickerhamiella sorbophila TaxID=45607 RepID=A0A2T0FGG7_9ASCO|nr:Transcription factor tau subunit [Wickerhamiella sorbophila]PRT54088.1 Transcription factor tau subunit [Wickerhamiella sorbophila]
MGPARRRAQESSDEFEESSSESDFNPEEDEVSPPPQLMPTKTRKSRRGQPVENAVIAQEPPAFKRESSAKPGSKDSLRDRFEFFFTSDEKRLVKAVRDRITWGHIPFAPDRSLYSVLAPEKGSHISSFASVNLTGAPAPPSGSPIVFEDATLYPGLTHQAKRVLLANFGHPVSCIAWAPYHEDDSQFLALGIVSGQKSPLDRNAVDPDLAVFSETGDLPAIFYIYSFNPSTEALNLLATFSCNFGPVVSFAWRPVESSRELAVVFQRGQMALIKADESGSFQIEDNVFQLPSKITCCAWRSCDELVVGTLAGELAEFKVDDGTAPSYVYTFSSSPISAIQTCYPDNSNFVFFSSMDGYSKIVDVRDLRHVRATVSQRARTFYTQAAWSPFVNSFVSCDDSVLSRLVPLIHSEVILLGLNMTRHKSTVTALAASPVHPMVLTGGIDGSVRIANAVTRAMVVKRAAKPPTEAIVWTLECSEATSTYRFVENLAVEPLGKPPAASEKLVLFPKTCTITSIDWIVSRAHGGWYAAATASGLVRIECLDQ